MSLGQRAQIICDQQYHDQPEKIFRELQKVRLGHLEKVVLQDCPIPPEPWSDIFTRMGVGKLRTLEFNGGGFATSRLGNMTELEVLEIKYVKEVHINDTEEGLPPSLISITIRNIGNLTSDQSPFSSLKNLRRLHIQNSNVQLSKDFFRGLGSLKEVSLMNDGIETIPEGLFEDLLRLKKLNLNRNNLRTLQEGVFRANIFLETVNLSDNCLENLPDKAFKNLTEMREFSMVNRRKCSGSKFIMPSDFLPESIEKFEFAMVNIQKLPQNLLQNCPNVKEFRVQKAKLKDVPDDLFSQTKVIQIIDFAGNEIKSIKPRLFRNLPHLTTLRLHYNKIEEINNNIFVNTRNIRHIELQHNQIRVIDDDLLLNLPLLQSLTLTNNMLQVSPYHTDNIASLGLKLERIYLSNNKIKQINVVKMLSGFPNIQVLDLQQNQLKGYLNLTAIDQINSTSSLELNFNSNKLDGVILKRTLDKKLNISIEKNPLKCDCYSAVIKDQENFSNIKIVPQNFLCEEGGISLLSKKPEELLCPADLVGADCGEGCECEVSTVMRHVRMTCDLLTSEHLTEALRVYKDWSVDLRVSSVRDPRLRLDLGGHNIRQLHLSNIDLEEVHLERIPETVRVIRLDNNNLKSIPNTIRLLKEVAAAQNIKQIDEEGFEVSLGDNPWQCNCENIELLHFAQNHYSRIIDQVNFDCDHLQDRDLRDLNIGDLCSDNIFVFHIIGVLIPIICILIIGVVMSYYRDLIIIYIFSKPWGKLLVSEEAIDKDKSHDVFISYSHEDAPWVEAVLLPGLERPEDEVHARYKCLVHSRDWVPGEAIPDQILGSVESSRRTVIVLSRDFVTSMWSNMEFRTAHSKAIKENVQVMI